MWRKAIAASTTFCQLRSVIFDLHMVNHVLSITLPACWELRYRCSNFSIRVVGDQRPCHVGGRRAQKSVSRPSSGDRDRRAPGDELLRLSHRGDAPSSSSARATCAGSSPFTQVITTSPERICPWTRIHPAVGRSTVWSNHLSPNLGRTSPSILPDLVFGRDSGPMTPIGIMLSRLVQPPEWQI